MTNTRESRRGRSERTERRSVVQAVDVALSSRASFVVVLTVFVVMGFAFAGWFHVHVAAAPDERGHVWNILLYAERPVLAGPYLQQVDPSQLWMGELVRSPLYLYHYLMSFPARGALAIGLDYEEVVFVLRAVDVLWAASGLIALRSLFQHARVPASIGLLAIVATAFTGRFTWQAASVSYDAPAMAALFVFAAVAVRFVRGGGLRTLAWMAVAALFALLMKYSQAPFVLAGGFFAILLRYRAAGWSWLRHPVQRAVGGLRARPGQSIVLLVIGGVLTALAIERFGLNLLQFHAVNPACTALHSRADCMDYAIFRRNYAASRAHDLAEVNGTLPAFAPLSFLWSWVTIYFQSLFFFWGASFPWRPNPSVVVFGASSAVVGIGIALTQARRILHDAALTWCAAVAATYTFAVLCFNAATMVNLGESYAFSGRYLLPAMPLAVVVVLVGVRTWLRRLRPRTRSVATAVVGVVLAALFVLYNPLSAFFPYAHSAAWYSDWGLDVLPRWLTGVES
ncbi:hypothetical protein [Curtobacterium flaccumfaciens]|uniref:hypothetical protein n=1 Tax=Curtobacterium flaccumfaciens TaxID=2035 RepID=UPI001BDDFA94|nr:hypothetical protein [Curtobacterium flaccumfaciens]MBT1672856.1 hypothetical protein [Curtobacterium flaccumfaciens pv. flaccumfaciens]